MFRTELVPVSSPVKISLKDSVLTIGSCFSDAIGNKLRLHKFNALVNPFGTVYNPISIHKLLRLATGLELIPSHSFLQTNDIHANYLFHSSFSSLKRDLLEQSIQKSISDTLNFIKQSDVLVMTYGTAWVYELTETELIVSNCHKKPSALFNKRLLSQREIVADYKALLPQLHSINPNLRVVMTLSPVRHLKDTLELNAVSKSVLRSSIHEIVNTSENTYYFPAYEIMMDDLRDYRFYKNDMLHPSEEAEEYIWQKFIHSYFDSSTQDFIKLWKEISIALTHRPFHPESVAHQKFLQSLLQKLQELKNIVNVDVELEQVKQQLIH